MSVATIRLVVTVVDTASLALRYLAFRLRVWHLRVNTGYLMRRYRVRP